ncbi:uncharacterized protein LOC100889715 isoform X2 [Strongylocentrotus purpuratus]|uniref:Uncharacterized protein n=1 Tax=Strongylocentrotus purpuratus TaxID=7668 RepID=A0A7M7NTY6_STRPU|nr:uncharacterized protein LOC100889715 isoform X2 [Strongylocentrotus purpuratus]
MSERQKLLDAARTAVNLLDAAHSAVDLLTTVLGTEEENGCHGNLTEQHRDVTDLPQTASKSTSEVWKTQIPEGKGPMRGASTLRIKDDTKPHSQNTAPSNIHRAASATIATDDGEKDETDIHSQMRNGRNGRDRRFSRAVIPRIPSQVAKVTPQRLIACEKRGDVIMEDAIGGDGGGGTEIRVEGWDHSFNEFVIEQAQASSILVLENAKLRKELHEAKTEVATLNKELSMNEVDHNDAEVQTMLCSHARGDHFYLGQGFNELASDDEDTDYLTTYSNSSPDRRYSTQANRSDGFMEGTRGAEVYFCTPGSNISTPRTLGRASTVSSSGGGLIRRKLELPKSLKNGGGYLSITSYEALTSDDDESSTISPGCCPFACFSCFGRRKSPQK